MPGGVEDRKPRAEANGFLRKVQPAVPVVEQTYVGEEQADRALLFAQQGLRAFGPCADSVSNPSS